LTQATESATVCCITGVKDKSTTNNNYNNELIIEQQNSVTVVTAYIIKRLLLAIPTIVGAVTIVFFAIHLAPGDPVALFVPADLPGGVREDAVEEIRERYGFDKPLYQQYFTYVSRMVRLDFGRSMRQRSSVADDLQRRILNTLQLGVAALAVSGVIGITFGAIAAVKKDSWLDNLVMFGALFGVSMPNFWLAMVLMFIFGLYWGVLPPSGFGGALYTWEGLQYGILPIMTLGISGSGHLARYTRSSMLEVINRDYVRTAHAKGLTSYAVIMRHALRNAMIPVITILGLSFGEVLSGAVIVETVFGWPGVGRYLVTGINGRDFPVVQATVLVIAIAFVIGNLLSDILIAYIDPRIRFD
jgi:peptide/nickel transport system permease protein